MTTGTPPSRLGRLAAALVIGALTALYAVARWRALGHSAADVDIMWAGARAVLAGHNPYASVGPGMAFEFPFGLYYPAPGIVLFLLLSPLPQSLVGPVFSALSFGAFSYTITRRSFTPLIAVASGAGICAAMTVQWSPLLTAAALTPWLGFLFVVKPNIGAALWLYRLEWRDAVSGLVLVGISFLLMPGWVHEWREVMRGAEHLRPPVLHLGGVLLLAAALRWRRPEARLLLGMALVPQTMLVYEALPLFLIPRTRVQYLLLSLLSVPVLIWQLWLVPRGEGIVSQTDATGDAMVALIYLPCLLMVLRRPNEGALPAWLARVGLGRFAATARAEPRATATATRRVATD